MKTLTPGKRRDPEQRKRSRRIILIILLAVVLPMLAALTGFLVFTRRTTTTSGKVRLDIDAPAMTASGDTVVIRVTAHNTDSVPATDVELSFQYPSGFVFERSTWSATDEEKTTFALGTIPSSSETTLEIAGTLIGTVDTTADFSVVSRYQPTNFSSTFESRDGFSIDINTSTLTLTLAGPTTVTGRQTAEYTITVMNVSPHAVEGLRVDVTLPTGYSLISSTPELVENRWRPDGPFPNGTSQAITLNGTFDASETENRELRAEVSIERPGGRVDRQQTESLIIFTVDPALRVDATVDGETTVGMAPDRTVNVDLTVTNSGSVALEDVRLTAVIASEYDGGSADHSYAADSAPGDGGTVDAQTVSWAQDSWPALTAILPNSTVSTRLSIQTADLTADDLTGVTNPRIVLTATVTVEQIEGESFGQEAYVVAASPLTISLAAPVTFTADGRYYDDALHTVGNGPLPPQVGATTTYRIMMTIATTATAVNGITVAATIPADADWTGVASVSAGEPFVYSPDTHIVQWTLNTIPSGRNGDNAVTAFFDVAIIPKASDVGTFMTLAEDITLAGMDAAAQWVVAHDADDITTAIPTDVKGKGNGRVVSGTDS